MKNLFIFALTIFSLNAFACPNISGTFYDADEDMVRNITQEGCTQTTWSDESGENTLITDGVERILQKEGDMTAFAKVYYAQNSIVIDIRMDWGKLKDMDLPARWHTSYKIDKNNNLFEKIVPFAADGTELATEYIIFKRMN